MTLIIQICGSNTTQISILSYHKNFGRRQNKRNDLCTTELDGERCSVSPSKLEYPMVADKWQLAVAACQCAEIIKRALPKTKLL